MKTLQFVTCRLTFQVSFLTFSSFSFIKRPKISFFFVNYCEEFIFVADRMLHPFFGCTRRERYFKISLYTSLNEICALYERKNTNNFRQLEKSAVSVMFVLFFGTNCCLPDMKIESLTL